MMNRQQKSESNFPEWEEHIQNVAASFAYPPTPDMPAVVRARLRKRPFGKRPSGLRTVSSRLAWAIAVVVLLMLTLLAVPQVRAAVLRFFQIGAITVFETGESPNTNAEIWASKSTPLPIVAQGVATRITLAEAQTAVSAGLFLPTYPADLGQPDAVYLAGKGWPQTVIFVWQEKAFPSQTRLALYQIGASQFAYKGASILEETAVNGQRAIWLEGPHAFLLANGQWEDWQFIDSNVLVWYAENGLTFRLEGADTLTEAVLIAESLEKLKE